MWPVKMKMQQSTLCQCFNPCSSLFSKTWSEPCMLIGHGKSRELIVLKPIYDALGCPLAITSHWLSHLTGCINFEIIQKGCKFRDSLTLDRQTYHLKQQCQVVAECEKLPPTKAALHEHILLANIANHGV